MNTEHFTAFNSKSTKDFCRKYLCDGVADFSVEVTADDVAAERIKSRRERELEGLPPYEFPDQYLETLALYRKIAEGLVDYGVILFHGSAIEMDGRAYIFTAKSGTGKSTHTRLWRKVYGDRVKMINDDKPFLHMENGQVTAFGSPWNGKHGLGCNGSVPLRAICILQRGEENVIEAIDAGQALPMLMQQSQRPRVKGNYTKYMELLNRLAGDVAFYRLACNMDPSAAVVAYEGMSKPMG